MNLFSHGHHAVVLGNCGKFLEIESMAQKEISQSNN